MNESGGKSNPNANGGNGGRDSKGRFTKGNSGGPGNPYVRSISRFRSALINSVSEDDISAVAEALIRKARDGDIAAFRVIAPYLLGQPPQIANKRASSDQVILLFERQDAHL